MVSGVNLSDRSEGLGETVLAGVAAAGIDSESLYSSTSTSTSSSFMSGQDSVDFGPENNLICG